MRQTRETIIEDDFCERFELRPGIPARGAKKLGADEQAGDLAGDRDYEDEDATKGIME